MTHCLMKTSNHAIKDWSPPGSTRTVPSTVHQCRVVKYATGASSKIDGRDNITMDTNNCRKTPLTNTGNGQVQMEHP